MEGSFKGLQKLCPFQPGADPPNLFFGTPEIPRNPWVLGGHSPSQNIASQRLFLFPFCAGGTSRKPWDCFLPSTARNAAPVWSCPLRLAAPLAGCLCRFEITSALYIFVGFSASPIYFPMFVIQRTEKPVFLHGISSPSCFRITNLSATPSGLLRKEWLFRVLRSGRPLGCGCSRCPRTCVYRGFYI